MRPLWLALLLPLPAAADAVLVDRIVATVDSRAITASAVELRAKQAAAGGTLTLKDARRDALEQLVEEQLIAADAQKLGLSVKDPEIEQALTEIAKQNELSVEQLLAEAAKQGLEPAVYRAMVGRQILELRWLGLKVSRSGPPTEEERGRWMAAQRVRSLAELRAKATVEVRP